MTTKRQPSKRTTTADTLPDDSTSTGARGRLIRFAIVFTVLVALGSSSELFILRARHAPEPTALQVVVADAAGWYQRKIAKLVGGAAGMMTDRVDVRDETVRIKNGSVVVAVECTGIKASAIFCAAVLAFPCAWSSKWKGILIGILGVGLLNFVRISALAWVKGFHADVFDTIHALLMQGFLILFVAPLWIFWMFRVTRVRNADPAMTEAGA